MSAPIRVIQLALLLGCLGLVPTCISGEDGPLPDSALYPLTEAQVQTACAAIRQRRHAMIVGESPLDTSDPIIKGIISRTTNAATHDMSSMSHAGSFLWSDTSDPNNLDLDLGTNYSRLLDMATAYSLEGSSLKGNAALLSDILFGLDWMHGHLYTGVGSESGNWYAWEIAGPTALVDILNLVYGHLSATQLDNNLNAIDHYVPNVDMTAANLADKAFIVAMRGALGNNATKLQDASSGVIPALANTTGTPHLDGFYSDGSFIQHMVQPYNGHYGKAYLDAMADIIYVLSGSPWQVNDPNVHLLYQRPYDSFEPLIYNNEFMDMVRGRAVAMYGQTDLNGTMGAIWGVTRLSQFAPTANARDFKAMVKGWVQNSPGGVSYNDVSTAQAISAILGDNTISPRPNVPTNKQYSSMDRVVHRRPTYALGLAMTSPRIANYECILGTNLKGWHTSEGATYLYLNDSTDQSYYANGYWAAIDQTLIPGTTVDSTPRADCSLEASTTSAGSAGGTSVGQYGVAGMDFHAVGSNLTAKKSWFMFDDEVVALGAGIHDTVNGGNVHTVVEDRVLADPAAALVVDNTAELTTMPSHATIPNVRWAYLAGTGGYYFPQHPQLVMKRLTRSGNWKDVKTNNPDITETKPLLQIIVDHGTPPVGGSYEYVLLPGADRTATSSYAASPDIAVLENSSTAQAVSEHTLSATGAMLWTSAAHSVGGITVTNGPAAVFLKDSTGTFTVSVADPTHDNTGKIKVTVAKGASSVSSISPGITVSSMTNSAVTFSVDVNASFGRTFTVVFKK
jgi:hyaluronate lyase